MCSSSLLDSTVSSTVKVVLLRLSAYWALQEPWRAERVGKNEISNSSEIILLPFYFHSPNLICTAKKETVVFSEGLYKMFWLIMSSIKNFKRCTYHIIVQLEV